MVDTTILLVGRDVPEVDAAGRVSSIIARARYARTEVLSLTVIW
jgi:hypothetical protein